MFVTPARSSLLFSMNRKVNVPSWFTELSFPTLSEPAVSKLCIPSYTLSRSSELLLSLSISSTVNDGRLSFSQLLTSELLLVLVGSWILYVRLPLLFPTEPFAKALWSMFMLTTDSAIGFCGTEAVVTVSSPNFPPEIAQHVDSFRLLPFAMAESRWSKLSDLVNWIHDEPRSVMDPAFVNTVLKPLSCRYIRKQIYLQPRNKDYWQFESPTDVSRTKTSMIPCAVPNRVLPSASLIFVGGFISL